VLQLAARVDSSLLGVSTRSGRCHHRGTRHRPPWWWRELRSTGEWSDRLLATPSVR